MQQPTASLHLPQNVINKLQDAGFHHCKDLEDNLDTINTKIKPLDITSLSKAPKAKPALELQEQEENFGPITTLIPELDPLFARIALPGCITELCGFPGSGKTQVCLHLAVGATSKVVFIHTNENLNPDRLREICGTFGADAETALAKILCVEATDPATLAASVEFLRSWVKENSTELVLIDGIAWPLRQLPSGERTKAVYALVQSLRGLGNEYGFTIVLTNDLTTRIVAAKEATEEFIQNEVSTELDAIHPRFMEPQDAAVIREYQIRHYYYCDECQLFFAPTVKALKVHFRGDMVEHKPYASCVYCKGEVFQYKFNNERKLYHNCRDSKKKEETDSEEEEKTD